MKYIGIDVSKGKLDCCLLQDLETLKRKNKSVPNSVQGIQDLISFFKKEKLPPSEIHVVMEGTGVYHQLAATSLSNAGIVVSVANPAQVKDFGRGLAVRTKTDLKDSFVLARYGALVKPKRWLPPPPEARKLQAYLTRQEALKTDLQREKNRKEKAEIGAVPKEVLDSIDAGITFLEKQIAALDKDICDHIDRDPGLKNDLDLLKTIPAVGPVVGRQMLSVIHNHDFRSAEQLAAYLGLVPVERQSGTSVHGRAHLSKAGPARIRACLYMPAIVAQKCNPDIAALRQRLLERGKSKMAIVGAAMRKLVHQCFGVLRSQEPYRHNPC